MSRRKASAAPHLCDGNHRAAAGRHAAACFDPDSLLALHPLEHPLNSAASRDALLVVVLGPTASGKTALSLKVAKEFRGEIVNCDSVAVYREFNIGTAKPSVAERALAPHYLIDCVDPTTSYTAGEYSRDARAILREIQKRGHVPIVAGGTGLYLRALLEGLFAGLQRSEELRERLRERASETAALTCIACFQKSIRLQRRRFIRITRQK